MHTAASEWAARVAARNEIETAKAARANAAAPQGGRNQVGAAELAAIKLLPLSAAGKEAGS